MESTSSEINTYTLKKYLKSTNLRWNSSYFLVFSSLKMISTDASISSCTTPLNLLKSSLFYGDKSFDKKTNCKLVTGTIKLIKEHNVLKNLSLIYTKHPWVITAGK